jgi:pimeloyl-ACP methyl ester carboxylesterase
MRHWFPSYNSQNSGLMQSLEEALRRKDPTARICFAPSLKRLLELLTKAPNPSRFDHRVLGNRAALLFVHGFSGTAHGTWSELIALLLREPSIQSWDVFGIGYPSNLRIDVPNVWSADPNLDVAARALRTTLALPPFKDYQALGIIAHSMGGLLVQRALVDDEVLTSRVTHVALFGTPSAGLEKARLFMRLKRQFRDMAPHSRFITKLRRDWTRRFGTRPIFSFRAIAGDRDEFVPASSSLGPFSDEFREVVPGNHVEMIRPISREDPSCQLLLKLLSGRAGSRSIMDSARIAVELGQFQTAVNTLSPRIGELDEAAVVSLALALEGLGQSDNALRVLEGHYRGGSSSSDAIGVLAGRLKRRWLAERRASDMNRARDLYGQGLRIAEEQGNEEQAFYHAINLAFLEVMAASPPGAITDRARNMADRARAHCASARDSAWRSATLGDACLVSRELSAAVAHYRDAVSKTNSPRDVDSMYSQAIRLAVRVCGEAGAAGVESVFGFATAQPNFVKL